MGVSILMGSVAYCGFAVSSASMLRLSLQLTKRRTWTFWFCGLEDHIFILALVFRLLQPLLRQAWQAGASCLS